MKTSLKYLFILLSIVVISTKTFGQIPPYTIPPKWMIGKRAGMQFPGLVGAPTTLTGNPDALAGQEATTTMCDSTSAISLYCNNSYIRDVGNSNTTAGGAAMPVNANNGQSSTGGAVTCPDPARPGDQFYVFSGNDITGGTSSGINWFRYRKNFTTGKLTRIDAGPAGGNNVAIASVATEALTVGSDGSTGYWVVGHNQNKGYMAWHVTTTGVSAMVASTGVADGGAGYAFIKISRCQNKIGFVSQAGGIDVYVWNRTSGTLGAAIVTYPNATHFNSYGCEFSPDGSKFYFSTLAGTLKQINLTAPFTITDLGGACCGLWLGSMTLGPDGKIYVANGNSAVGEKNIGVISNPNVAGAGCNYDNDGFTLGAGTDGTNLGIANEPWINPMTPVISNANCPTVTFGYEFKTYYLQNIDTSRVDWDFGTGTYTKRGATPSHTFTSSGAKTIRIKVTDQVCSHEWTATKIINIGCPLPVEWLQIDAINKGNNVIVSWSTAKEENNHYFVIERSSDGISFTSIGTVKGKGNSTEISNYQFLDEYPLIGNSYYRVVQYDINQDFSTSPVVAINVTNDISIDISPNPTSGEFKLNITGISEASYFISDVLGRELLSDDLNFMEESTEVTFGSSLTQGTYILKILYNNQLYTHKLIKE